MERVVFIIEGSEEQIPCLLNPESLLLQRRSGVNTKNIHGGLVSGKDLADSPLFFTGGGSTDLTVNLLFDVNLSGSEAAHADVRVLTGPLWQLTENQVRADGGRARPAIARFVWGKAFNYPGVVTDISERLEYFTTEGVPQRSFIRLKMRRVTEHLDDISGGAVAPPIMPEDLNEPPPEMSEDTFVHSVLGATASDGEELGDAERVDQVAHNFYGDPSLWRLVAWVNKMTDPTRIEAGTGVLLPASEKD